MVIKKTKWLFVILMLIMIMISGYSVNQQVLLDYEFEEGSGSLVFDGSGNDNTAVVNGAKWRTSPSMNDDYVMYFDGGNDYLTSINMINVTSNYSVSFWGRFSSTNNKAIFVLQDQNELQGLYLISGSLVFRYNTINNNQIDFSINDISFNTNTWYFIVINIDTINSKINVSVNNNPFNNYQLSNPILTSNSKKTLRIGVNERLNNDFNGYLDSFRVFNFQLNSSQVNELYHYNNVTLLNDKTNIEEVNDTINVPLINQTSPLDTYTTTDLEVTFSYVFNKVGTCELYIDNQYYATIEDKLQGTFSVNFDEKGKHGYLFNCWYIENGTKYYDISGIKYFNITSIPKSIDFYLYAHNDSLLYGNNLYIVTPCFRSSFGYYGNQINDNRDFYIRKLEDGHARMILEAVGSYEFCLVRGQININNDTYFNNDYDIVKINKQINLGNITIYNDSRYFGFRLGNNDLYNAYDPAFWDRTWSSLFNLIISIIIGGVIIYIGIMLQQPKVIVAGTIVILAGMGVTLSSLIIGGIF